MFQTLKQHLIDFVKRSPWLCVLPVTFGLIWLTDWALWKSGYGGTPDHAPANVGYLNPPILTQQSFGSPKALRFLALGDWGYKSYIHADVARGLQKYCKTQREQGVRVDAVLLAGDNFYPRGVNSLTDEKWTTLWKSTFDPTELDCYVTLGNHDYRNGLEFGQLQVTQSGRPGFEKWICRDVNGPEKPGIYYKDWFYAGDLAVQLVVIDTNTLVARFPELHSAARKHLHWLADSLKDTPPKRSRLVFRLVLGHHPVSCFGEKAYDLATINGPLAALGPERKTLKDLLLESAEMYVCGHAHCIQFVDLYGHSVRPKKGEVHGHLQQLKKSAKMQLVTGTGSKVRRLAFWGEACYYSARLPGFASITLDPVSDHVTVAFHDTRGGNASPIYAVTFPLAAHKVQQQH